LTRARERGEAAPMLEVALLPLSPTVEPAVLALNNAHAAELSWLDGDRLTFLVRQAFHARRNGEAFRNHRIQVDIDTVYSRVRGVVCENRSTRNSAKLKAFVVVQKSRSVNANALTENL